MPSEVGPILRLGAPCAARLLPCTNWKPSWSTWGAAAAPPEPPPRAAEIRASDASRAAANGPVAGPRAAMPAHAKMGRCPYAPMGPPVAPPAPPPAGRRPRGGGPGRERTPGRATLAVGHPPTAGGAPRAGGAGRPPFGCLRGGPLAAAPTAPPPPRAAAAPPPPPRSAPPRGVPHRRQTTRFGKLARNPHAHAQLARGAAPGGPKPSSAEAPPPPPRPRWAPRPSPLLPAPLPLPRPPPPPLPELPRLDGPPPCDWRAATTAAEIAEARAGSPPRLPPPPSPPPRPLPPRPPIGDGCAEWCPPSRRAAWATRRRARASPRLRRSRLCHAGSGRRRAVAARRGHGAP